MDKVNPYISFVIAFRNDNYTENANEKLNLSLNTLICQLDKFALDSEIIIVDWNTPEARRPLIDEIKLQINSKFVSVIIYEVENAIHQRYKGHENIALVGEVCANVGIRRSRGAFVLNKTGDSFYSEELVRYISERTLSKDVVYRADRVEVKVEIPVPELWEHHFKNNIIARRTNTSGGIYIQACGDFMLMHKEKWSAIRGFPETKKAVTLGCDGEALYASIGAGAVQECLVGDLVVYKISHERMYAARVAPEKLSNNRSLKQYLGTGKRNSVQKAVVFLIRILLGILNLPRTRISNLRTRSIYRWYLVSILRRLLWGGGIFKNGNWGLYEDTLPRKVISSAKWDL
jgi:hypothetical protein